MERKPIDFRQLCALVKGILQAEPTIDDGEWKARTKDQMAKWGFEEPNPLMLDRALSQVENALRQTLGPRPIAPTSKASRPAKPEPPAPQGRTNRPEGWDIVVALMAKLRASGGSAPSLPARPDGPRETLPITERAAVDEFWHATQDGAADRVALLRAFAEIAILRPSDWDQEAIRAHAHEHRLSADYCFACLRAGTLSWHHIIQIQHGGSNYLRNRVALCRACHQAIHPWLPAKPETGRTLGDWSHISECMGGALDAISQRRRKKDTA
jgi:hypothetical protein